MLERGAAEVMKKLKCCNLWSTLFANKHTYTCVCVCVCIQRTFSFFLSRWCSEVQKLSSETVRRSAHLFESLGNKLQIEQDILSIRLYNINSVYNCLRRETFILFFPLPYSLNLRNFLGISVLNPSCCCCSVESN